MPKIVSENFIHALLLFLGLFRKISRWVPLRFIIILDFFENELHVNLRNFCKLDENVISRYLRGNVASLGNLLLSEAS